MRKALAFLSTSLVSIGVFAVACSSSEPIGGDQSCADFGEFSEDASCDGLCGVANDDFCAGVATTPDCDKLRPGATVDVCGVVLEPPLVGGELLELTRSNSVDEFAGSGPPSLGCFDAGGFPAAPGTSMPVTLSGIAKIFSSGCESDAVEISVYTVVRDGSANDGMFGELVGTTVVTPDDCTGMVNGAPEENEDCTDVGFDGNRWECRFTYPGVPSETELLMKTEGAGWATLYEYNVYVPNSEVVDGVFNKDVRALAQDDYTVIPQTAMGKNIEPGNGALGGEVHDCGDVRLSNAIVDIDAARAQLTYFTDDELKPLPDVNAQVTSTLGLYVALDVKAGPVNVAAAGVVDGKLVGVGFFKARVYPDAVTSVTFRGLRPFQLP